MAKEYTMFHIPVFSFYSRRLYRDIAANGKGTGFLYLFFILTVCLIPITIHMQSGINKFIEEDAPRIVNQIPKMTFVKGTLSIDEPQPYTIEDPDTGNPLIIIDTTGKTENLNNTKAFGLLMKDRGLFRESSIQTKVYSYSEIKNDFVLTHDKINKWMLFFKKNAMWILGPIMLISLFVFRIIQLLIYAGIGMIFVNTLDKKLSYRTVLRLSTAAITPFIIMGMFFDLANFFIPFRGLIFLVGALYYLYFGISSCQDSAETTVEVVS